MSPLLASWLTPTSLFLLLNIMIGTIFLISRLSPPKTPHHQQFGNDGYNSAPPVLQRAPSLLDRVKSISFSTYKFPLPNQDVDYPLERAPSILERVKTIDFSLYKYSPQNPDMDYIQAAEQDYTNPQPLSRSPSLLERVKSIEFITSFYRWDSVKSNQQMEPPPTEEAVLDMIHVDGQVKTRKSEYSKVKQRKSPKNIKISASENSRRKADEEEDQEEEEEEEEEEVEKRRTATTRMKKTVSFGDDDQGVDAKADDFINKFKQQLKLQRLDSLLRYRDMLKGK